MKTSWRLANIYLSRHRRKFSTSILCIAVFTAALFCMQMFTLSYHQDRVDRTCEQYGYFEGAYRGISPDQIPSVYENPPRAKTVGLAQVFAYVNCPGVAKQIQPCIGSLDEKAKQLITAKLLDGTWPGNANEVAISQNAYDVLGLTAEIGDSVLLPVIAQDSGSYVNQSFTLTGILSSYRNIWATYSAGDALRMTAFPDILTAADAQKPITAHVLMADMHKSLSMAGAFDTNMMENYLGSRTQDGSSVQFYIITSVLAAFLVLLIILGIHHITQILLSEERQYIGLLRCVGAQRGRIRQMLLLQGGIFAVISVILGLLLGVMLFFLSVTFLNRFVFNLSYALSPLPFLTTSVVGLASILLTYRATIHGLLKKPPLRLGAEEISIPRRPKSMPKRFTRLWLRAHRRTHSEQSWTTGLLAAFCMLLIVFAPFYSDLVANYSYQEQEKELAETGMDYWFGLRNGATSMSSLGLEYPRHKGVGAASFSLLGSDPNLIVDSAVISAMSSARIYLEPNAKPGKSVEKLIEKNSWLSRGDSRDRKEALLDAGYPDGSNLLLYRIKGVPASILQNMQSHLKAGTFDSNAFDAGREAVAFGSDFQVGDVVPITITSYPDTLGSQQENDQSSPKPTITNFSVRVSAVYDVSQADSIAMKRILWGGNTNGLCISDKVLLAADPGAGYDDVCVSLRDPSDLAAKESAELTLRQVLSHSYLSHYIDFTQTNSEKLTLSQRLKLPYYVMIGVFLLTVFTAMAIAMDLKVKNSVRHFAMLRAVGLSGRRLRKLLLLSNLIPTLIGLAAGTALGVSLDLILQFYMGSESFSLYLSTMLPCIGIGTAALLLFGVVSCLLPIRWIMRRPVTQGIENTLY